MMRRWPNPRSFTLARSERNELAGDAVAKHWISSRPQHRRTLCQTCFALVPVRSPRAAPGALADTAVFNLPADLDAGSTTRAATAGVTGGDNLDPECVLVLEVRGVTGLAQVIQAVLRRTRGCGRELRKQVPGGLCQVMSERSQTASEHPAF